MDELTDKENRKKAKQNRNKKVRGRTHQGPTTKMAKKKKKNVYISKNGNRGPYNEVKNTQVGGQIKLSQ